MHNFYKLRKVVKVHKALKLHFPKQVKLLLANFAGENHQPPPANHSFMSRQLILSGLLSYSSLYYYNTLKPLCQFTLKLLMYHFYGLKLKIIIQ